VNKLPAFGRPVQAEGLVLGVEVCCDDLYSVTGAAAEIRRGQRRECPQQNCYIVAVQSLMYFLQHRHCRCSPPGVSWVKACGIGGYRRVSPAWQGQCGVVLEVGLGDLAAEA
jgi:hypothetical protein